MLTDLGGRDSNAEDVALQSDGKILVVGNVIYDNLRGVSNALLLRYLPDGSLDASFGEGGVSETNYGYYSNAVFTVAVQADGRIVTGAATRTGGKFRGYRQVSAMTDAAGTRAAILRGARISIHSFQGHRTPRPCKPTTAHRAHTENETKQPMHTQRQ